MLNGCGYGNDKYYLETPSVRTFAKVEVQYDVPRDSKFLIQLAVHERQISSKLYENKPEVNNYYGPVSFKSAFQRILSKHPYPFYQSPLGLELKSLMKYVQNLLIA